MDDGSLSGVDVPTGHPRRYRLICILPVECSLTVLSNVGGILPRAPLKPMVAPYHQMIVAIPISLLEDIIAVRLTPNNQYSAGEMIAMTKMISVRCVMRQLQVASYRLIPVLVTLVRLTLLVLSPAGEMIALVRFRMLPLGLCPGIDPAQNHSCAIDTSGAISCWGEDLYGYNMLVNVSGPYIDVITSNVRTCALDTAGEITCWGYDDGIISNIPSGSFRHLISGTDCAIDTL